MMYFLLNFELYLSSLKKEDHQLTKRKNYFKKMSGNLLISLLLTMFTTGVFFSVDSMNIGKELTALENVQSFKNGMELIWCEEFDVDGKPDQRKWTYEFGFVRNRELQWYQPQNAYCKNGSLIIEARRERTDNPHYNPHSNDWRTNREFAEYTSSCLHTKGLFEFTGEGYFEFKARIDTSMGSWPAIWLLGTQGGWPYNGEIDIMEFYRINNEPHLLANVAWGSSKSYSGEWDSEKIHFKNFLKNDPNWVKKYHVWSMHWDQSTIKLYLDGSLLNTVDLKKTVNPDGSNPFEPTKKFYLLLNLAIGSNGGDPSRTKFPIRFEVDYVRIYQKVR
jgi:beta-glucanase (GH16 family)